MIPHFDYIAIPFGMRLLLKEYLKNTFNNEQFVIHTLSKDLGMKVLISKYLSVVAKDQGHMTIMKNLGWDYFRRAILSFYIYKELHQTWPEIGEKAYVDLPFMTLDEHFSQYSVKGHFRHSLLAFYLRILEIRLSKIHHQQPISILGAISHCLELIGRPKRPVDQGDLIILMLWHFIEYFHIDEIKLMLKQGENFSVLYQKLGPAFQQTMMENIGQYLLSIGDKEAFTWDMA